MRPSPCAIWKHLHVRGENCNRIHLRIFLLRNTSTCVEKTFWLYNFSTNSSETPPRAWRKLPTAGPTGCNYKKHLHVRGENLSYLQDPARAAQKHLHVRGENPHRRQYLSRQTQKHLHVRGENENHLDPDKYIEETPPRAWRKLGTMSPEKRRE